MFKNLSYFGVIKFLMKVKIENALDEKNAYPI